MLADAGARLDAVVVLTVDDDELVQRLLHRAKIEGRADDTEDVIRHRQDVYNEQTAPLLAVYAEPRPARRGRRHGRGRRGHRPDLRRARRRSAAKPPAEALTLFRDRGIEIKTPEQIDKMRVAGLVVGRDARAAAYARSRPG